MGIVQHQGMRWVAMLIALCPVLAQSQSYPAKPIRLVVPYAAGGATDNYARVMAPKFSEAWGQQMIIENRPGAGGNIGSAVVAKAPPDGYTALLNTAGQAIAPALYRKLPYDAAKELQPVFIMVRGVQMLMVSPAVTATSVKELIAQIKAAPGKFNFGSNGVGSGPHLAGELFRSLAGLDVVHIPYKGDAAMTPALMSNEVQYAFLPAAAGTSLAKAGKLKALGVASGTRTTFFPDLPSLSEAGVPGYELSTWAGFFLPGGTPRDIVVKMSNEGVRIMKLPDIQKFFNNIGVETLGLGVEGFEQRYKEDLAKYAKLIREAGIPQED
ncbi:MAG: Bug family tripartite tricarboxylate transporter substrate binding protein [Burkholderiales bacterium]